MNIVYACIRRGRKGRGYLGIEELREKREKLKIASDITLNNMQMIADESSMVAQVAHHSGKILKNLDKEFES